MKNLKSHYVYSILIICSVFIWSSCNSDTAKQQVPAKESNTVPKPKEGPKMTKERPIPPKSNNTAQKITNDEKYPTVTNIKSGDNISSPVKIEVNSEGRWFAFEGELGTVTLVDEAGKQLGLGILSTKENWMKKGPVIFNTELKFESTKSGKGKLIFKNNNASDNRALDKSFQIDVFYSGTKKQ